MPNRSMTEHGPWMKSSGYDRKAAPPRVNAAEADSKRRKGAYNGGRSVKKLVRSLSDRYAAVTSPLTCKKKTSCSSKTPSLKLMKTTTTTSMLPLNPALSVLGKPITRTTTHPTGMRKEHHNSRLQAAPVKAITMPKQLFDMQYLACMDSTASNVITKRLLSKEEELKQTFRARNPASCMKSATIAASAPTVKLLNLSTKDENTDVVKRCMTEIEALSARSLAVNHTRACQVSKVHSRHADRTEPELQKLEALLKFKDDELCSIHTAGLMLKDLCLKQEDELKTVKAAFPATLKEIAQLREACDKQEKELAYSRVAIPALQAQVSALTAQLKTLTEELAQMKSCKEASSENVSSHFHEREPSNSSSTLSREPSPLTNGFLEQLRRSRREADNAMPQKLPSDVVSQTASSCSSVMTADRSGEISRPNNGKHRRGFSAVLSVEQMLKGSGRRTGRRMVSDMDIADTLQALDHVANREQALLQERCSNVVKELRSSSSRFTSLEPLKAILTCASPQLFGENEEMSPSTNMTSVNLWNLKPT